MMLSKQLVSNVLSRSLPNEIIMFLKLFFSHHFNFGGARLCGEFLVVIPQFILD